MACNPNGQQERRLNQFNKICLLDSLTKELAKLSNTKLEINYNPVGEFEELIDLDNAHATLETMMINSEKCFAEVVEKLIDQGISINTLGGIVKERGLEFDIDPNSTLEEAYNFVNSIILDGMPCDGTKQIIKSNVKELVWELKKDLHSKYWQNPSIYWQIYDIILKALISNADIKYLNSNNKIFTLYK